MKQIWLDSYGTGSMGLMSRDVSMLSKWETRREGGGEGFSLAGSASAFSSIGGGAWPFRAASFWSCQSAESKYLWSCSAHIKSGCQLCGEY